jgi:hypothetical protein
MGENPYIPTTLVQQDLERLRFSQNLRRNPGDYSAYVNTRINEMTDEIFNRKRTAFQKAHIDLSRYMDMDHNSNFYATRSADVSRMTSAMAGNNERIKRALINDKDLSKRQFEINEWYNYNKLETLFYLQLFFIVSLTMAIIIYLQKGGTISNAGAAGLTMVLCAIVAIVGVYRYYYTNRIRDTRLWHRRTFEKAPPVHPPVKCDPNGNIDIDLNSVFPEAATECAAGLANKFGSFQDSLINEISSFSEDGKAPSSLTGTNINLSDIKGSVCGS